MSNNCPELVTSVLAKPWLGFVTAQRFVVISRVTVLFYLRDIKVPVQTDGVRAAWAVIRPVTMLVFYLFFGRLAKIPSDGIPYPLFVYCALVPWTSFSRIGAIG